MVENSNPVKPIAISIVASQHLEDIYRWYEKKQVGLGERFLSGITTTFQKIQRTPTIGQVTHEPHRRVIMGKFPYGIFYEEQETQIIISGVIHTARNPDDWQNLLE
jgi:toxin ParE1/3/4